MSDEPNSRDQQNGRHKKEKCMSNHQECPEFIVGWRGACPKHPANQPMQTHDLHHRIPKTGTNLGDYQTRQRS